jgi:inner membrane protein
MDPVTQGILGTTAAQLVSKRNEKMEAAGIGFLSGLAADIDVVFRSDVDPLLFLEYHRHFTHALIFIPLGALLCSWLYIAVKRVVARGGSQSLAFSKIYMFAFAGYATHALLDACTTYGTQLFFPFSNMRVAWNNVSVVDPLFSIPLLMLITIAVLRRSNLIARVAAIYAVSYLLLGVVQQHRALAVAEELAHSRGHQPQQLGMKPSFANIIVWKSVYQYAGRYYVDAIRIGFTAKVYPGVSTPKTTVDQQFPWLQANSQQAKDIERFRWFSNDHLGLDPINLNRIIDVRYSLVPNRLDGMWGIVLDPQADLDEHVEFNTSRPEGAQLRKESQRLWSMVLGH